MVPHRYCTTPVRYLDRYLARCAFSGHSGRVGLARRMTAKGAPTAPPDPNSATPTGLDRFPKFGYAYQSARALPKWYRPFLEALALSANATAAARGPIPARRPPGAYYNTSTGDPRVAEPLPGRGSSRSDDL